MCSTNGINSPILPPALSIKNPLVDPKVGCLTFTGMWMHCLGLAPLFQGVMDGHDLPKQCHAIDRQSINPFSHPGANQLFESIDIKYL